MYIFGWKLQGQKNNKCEISARFLKQHISYLPFGWQEQVGNKKQIIYFNNKQKAEMLKKEKVFIELYKIQKWKTNNHVKNESLP